LSLGFPASIFSFLFFFSSPKFQVCSGGPQKLHFEAGKPSLNLFLFKGLVGWGLPQAPLPPGKRNGFSQAQYFFSKGWRNFPGHATRRRTIN
jgi:hypothetical protein